MRAKFKSKNIVKTSAPRKIWAYKKCIQFPEHGSGLPGLYGMAIDRKMTNEKALRYKITCYPESEKPFDNIDMEAVGEVVEYFRADVIQKIQSDLDDAQEEIENLRNELEEVWKNS